MPATGAAAARSHPVRTRRPTFPTPSLLRLAMVVVPLGIVVFGVIGVRASLVRSDATDTVGLDASPLLVGSANLYRSLADADAAASTAFLQAGSEPPALRARYVADIRAAGEALAEIALHSDLSAPARQAVATIVTELPIYHGLIESARANNLQGFPVGKAYLRRASDRMRTTILPAATSTVDHAGRQLDDGRRAGTSPVTTITAFVAGGVALVLVAAAGLMLFKRTNRIVNLGLAGAAVLVVAALATTGVLFAAHTRALERAQREGADPLLVLATTRILVLRALSDENLDLIERHTSDDLMDDFDRRLTSIGDGDIDSGLLGEAQAAAAPGERSRQIARARGQLAELLQAHAVVRRLVDTTEYQDAVTVALIDEASAAARLGATLDGEIAAAATSLDDHTDHARALLRWLPPALMIAALGAAALAVVGLNERLREYR